MATPPLVIGEAPTSAGVEATSEAGKVEASTKKWSREISFALRSLYSQVQNLAGTTSTTAGATKTDTVPSSSRKKIDAPVAAVSDSEVVIFSGTSGTEVKSGGPLPRNFSVVLDMGVLNPGAAVSITYGLNVRAMKLKAKASGGFALPGSSLPNKIVGAHDHDDAGNSLANVQFVIYMTDGTALPAAGLYRLNFAVFP